MEQREFPDSLSYTSPWGILFNSPPLRFLYSLVTLLEIYLCPESCPGFGV